MKTFVTAMCIALFVAGVSYGEAKDAPGENLVANGSFEAARANGLPEKWSARNTDATGAKTSVKVDKQESYKGLQSVMLENTAVKGLVVIQNVGMIQLSQGAHYTLTGYIKADMDSIEPGVPKKDMKRFVYLIVQSYDENKKYADVVYCKPMIPASTDGWTELKIENFVLPDKCKSAEVWCVVNGGYTRAWFDNISFVKTDK